MGCAIVDKNRTDGKRFITLGVSNIFEVELYLHAVVSYAALSRPLLRVTQMKYPEHTATQFDIELMTLCESVQRMAQVVEQQFCHAMDALETRDLALAERVLSEGVAVNALQIEIDESSTSLLVRRQPTANDLRLVSTVIKMINDLERVGDEAENIARIAIVLAQKTSCTLPRLRQIKYIAEIALEMLKGALAAFDARDSEAARAAGRKEALIDEEFRSVVRHIVGYMMEDASEITTALQVVCVARSIECIGDHAKNIAEYVVYMNEGRAARNYTPESLS